MTAAIAELYHSPAELVRAALVLLGLGSDPDAQPGAAWPCYATFEPVSPDRCITCYDAEAVGHGRSMPDAEQQKHLGAQVRVRALDHRTGYRKASDVKAALDDLYDLAVVVDSPGGTVYVVHSFNRTTDIVSLGKEYPEGARSLFTLNGMLTVRRL